jgi:5'-methylthioadenosine phosphorylase
MTSSQPFASNTVSGIEPVALGVFGGSGFYEFLDDPIDIDVETPFGPASAPISIGSVAGHRVAFLARHGRKHGYAAHRVPYRANLWAMHQLGVRSIIAPCSVGSLQPDIHPGQLVVVDQLVDRSWGRPDTFHDVGGPAGEPGTSGPVHHQSFAYPYHPALRAELVAAGRRIGAEVRDGGTMVVINGPRFSTRAESLWFRSMGWHVVNMTGYPEAVLAAELGIRYASIALATDYDAGVDGHEPVTMDAVFAVMHANVARVRALIVDAIAHSYQALTAFSE